MKKYLLIWAVTIALLLTACVPAVTNPTGSDTTTSSVPTSTSSVPTSSAPTSPSSSVMKPSEEELAPFNELFKADPGLKLDERNPYHLALGYEYTSAKDVPLIYLFDEGLAGEHEITDEEWEELSKKVACPEECPGDFNRLPKDKMEQRLQTVFGISLEDLSDSAFIGLFYLECTDCYCWYQSGSGYFGANDFHDIKYNDDGTVLLTYNTFSRDMFVVTLKPNGDSYQILSNVKMK